MNKLETSVKALISCIPYFGGAIASIIGDYCSDRKEERLMEFLTNLQRELNEKQEQLIREYIESSDFLDVFENILRDVMNTRTEVKRNMLKNLLVNSCIFPHTSYERTEAFQHLIDVLSPTSLVILSVFYNAQNIMMDGKKESVDIIWSRIREITKTTDESDSLLMEYIDELESRYLIESFRNNTYSTDSGVPLVGDRPYITEKGIAFYKYVTMDDNMSNNVHVHHNILKSQMKSDGVPVIEFDDIDNIVQ